MTQISIKHHDFIWVLKKQKQLYFPLTQNKISWGGSFLRWVIQSWLGCLSLAIARACREHEDKRFPLQSRWRAGGVVPGAQPPPPAAPEARFSTTRACRAQLAPRAVRIHPRAFQCSHGKGGSEEEVGLGSRIDSTSQQTPPGHSTRKTKLPLLPPLSGVRIALRSAAVGEAALPPARNLQGLCLHQCSCQVPRMQPSCWKPKRAPNSVNRTVLLHLPLQSRPIKCPLVTK